VDIARSVFTSVTPNRPNGFRRVYTARGKGIMDLGSASSMNLRSLAKRLLPGFNSRLVLRRAINLPRDAFEGLTGRRDPLVPPHGLWFVGGESDYKRVNQEYLGYFVNLGGLRPDYRVLDVGCGIGITASSLTSFLDPQGSYAGFDIVRVGIAWAQKNIAARFPNFSFVHADIFNKHYNPKGKLSSSSFRFPYEDASFDFVFLKSVFTHLLPDSIQNYLQEIRRVMKPSGTCLATLFLMNPESQELIRRGQSPLKLVPYSDDCCVVDAKFPETAVGILQSAFLQWSEKSGLGAKSPIHYGSWCGRKNYMSYQDIALLAPIL
jgi:ubiquinone/menaquinone biosynthesis C-methylase UbiE